MKTKYIFLIILSAFLILCQSIAFAGRDTTPPTGSVTINSGATYTNLTSVTLTLSASDSSGVSQMCISNTTSCSSWETYATTKSWTLSTGDGAKTVYAWFKDKFKNPTPPTTPYSDSIILDTTAPANGTLSATAGNAQVPLSWSGFSDSGGSGLKSTNTYKVMRSTGTYPSNQCTSGTQVYLGSGSSITDTGLTNGTTYYYRACAYDNANNVSTGATASAQPSGTTDTTPDQFTFIDQAGVALNTVVSSNTITVSGINAASPISITGGTYSANGGAYTSASGTVTNGATVTVRVTSSGSYSTTVNATLTIGGVSDTFSVTTQASFSGSIAINNNAAYTNSASVTLTLSCTKTGGTCTQMQFSNDNVSWSAAETYATTKVWTLTTGDGTKTVFVKFKDNSNIWSNAYSDTIFLDTVPPQCSVIINNGVTYTNSPLVTLTLSAIDPNPGSGVAQMCVSNTNASCSSWVTYATTMTWTLLTGDGTKYVYAWFKDNAGNVTATPSTTSDSIILDTTAPQPVTGLTATAISSSQINLSWSPSYDTGGSGLAGYKVNRVSPSTKQLDPTTATNCSDSGLTANTQYCYTVAAYDNAGNTSAQSAQVCATTQGGISGWSKSFGSMGDDRGNSVTVDSGGNVIMTGYFSGTVDFGGGPLTSSSYPWIDPNTVKDIFVAKYSASGTHLWSKRFGSEGDEQGRAVAVDIDGDLVVVGACGSYKVDFGGGPLTGVGGYDIFVAKYSASGTHLWSKRFGGTDYDYGNGVAIDGGGNVIVTGNFFNTADFGGGPLTSAGGSDIFVAKYSPDGAHIWSKRFGGTAYDYGTAVTVDSSGNIYATGSFYGTVNFGGGALTSAGGYDIFVAKYSPDGAHIWSKRFGSAGDDYASGIAVDVSGNVIVTGYFSGSVNFGGGALTSAGGYDIFVAKYSSVGTHLWSKRFGSTNDDYANGIAVDNSDNVFLTGAFYGTVDFGGGPLSSIVYDMFVAKYSSSGAHLLSEHFGGGGAGDQFGSSVAVDQIGNMVATGYFQNTIDFGYGSHTSAGSFDIFLVNLGY